MEIEEIGSMRTSPVMFMHRNISSPNGQKDRVSLNKIQTDISKVGVQRQKLIYFRRISKRKGLTL